MKSRVSYDQGPVVTLGSESYAFEYNSDWRCWFTDIFTRVAQGVTPEFIDGSPLARGGRHAR